MKNTNEVTTDNKGGIRTKAFISICVHAIYTRYTCGCTDASDAVCRAICQFKNIV